LNSIPYCGVKATWRVSARSARITSDLLLLGKGPMQIYLNGKEREIPEKITMRNLVQELDLGDQRFAIEVNEELVPRSSFDKYHLKSGDRVEVVQAIGGG
jgi:thiamine biosynthesis protein ThiS